MAVVVVSSPALKTRRRVAVSVGLLPLLRVPQATTVWSLATVAVLGTRVALA